MVASALQVLREELLSFIRDEQQGGSADEVVLGNIAFLEGEGGAGALQDKIVLSLVNVEEEKRLKNVPRTRPRGNTVEVVNPPISLNLYLLFSSNYKDYHKALRRLSQVITFFQSKFVFTESNAPAAFQKAMKDEVAPMAGGDASDMKIILDIHTLNFEQINDLWGSLGGKQVPFVIYRARLLRLQREAIQGETAVIDEINEVAS